MDDDYDDNDDNVVMCEWIGDKRSKEDNKRRVIWFFSNLMQENNKASASIEVGL